MRSEDGSAEVLQVSRVLWMSALPTSKDPHGKAISKALFGAEADMDQQVAGQYFAFS